MKNTLIALLVLLPCGLTAQERTPRVVEDEPLACSYGEWHNPQMAIGAALAYQDASNILGTYARETFPLQRPTEQTASNFNRLILTYLVKGIEANAVYLLANGDRAKLTILLNTVNTQVLPPFNYTFTLNHAYRAFDACLRKQQPDERV